MVKIMINPCKNCRKRMGHHSRGLCSVCFVIEEVRNLYPPRRLGYYGSRDFNGIGKMPKEPTYWPPGSEGKIDVMTDRASNNEQLFHPLDATMYLG